jgi:hypothetical protein
MRLTNTGEAGEEEFLMPVTRKVDFHKIRQWIADFDAHHRRSPHRTVPARKLTARTPPEKHQVEWFRPAAPIGIWRKSVH